MSRPEQSAGDSAAAEPASAPASTTPGAPAIPGPRGSRYGWFVGVVALLILALITVNTIVTNPNGSRGIAPGHQLPPFAVPLALGSLKGDANIATRPHQGSAGNRPACSVRGPQVFNICQLYERGPVVLALFVASGSCPQVLDDMQRMSPAFPGVQFGAVAIGGNRGHVRSLIRTHGWTFPVGYSRDVAVANLYKLATCPQVTLAYPGGTVAQEALLSRPAPSVLRADVASLVAGARARGWQGAG